MGSIYITFFPLFTSLLYFTFRKLKRIKKFKIIEGWESKKNIFSVTYPNYYIILQSLFSLLFDRRVKLNIWITFIMKEICDLYFKK